LSEADVRRIWLEEREKGEILERARSRPGMTPELVSWIASRPLTEVRDVVARFAPAPQGGEQGTTNGVAKAAVNEANLSAAAGRAGAAALDEGAIVVRKYGDHMAPDLTLEEGWEVERLRRSLGVSPEAMKQARQNISEGRGGVASMERIN